MCLARYWDVRVLLQHEFAMADLAQLKRFSRNEADVFMEKMRKKRKRPADTTAEVHTSLT